MFMKTKTKRFCYCLLFFSFFSAMLALSIKPTYAYDFSLPDFVKDAELESQVTVYDETEWEKHLGKGAFTPDEYFGGNADEVGAKSKDKVLDWEEDREHVAFIEDRILTREVEVAGAPDVSDFADALDYIRGSVNGLVEFSSDPNSAAALLAVRIGIETAYFDSSITQDTYLNESMRINTLLTKLCENYSVDYESILDTYGEKFDGTLLLRDHWDYTTSEFAEKGDVLGDEAPIFKDPNAWYENYELIIKIKGELLGKVGTIISTIQELDDSLGNVKTFNEDAWNKINETTATTLIGRNKVMPALDNGGDDIPHLSLDASLNPTGENPLQIQTGGKSGLLTVETEVAAKFPLKFGFLYQLMIEGIPVYSPGNLYLMEATDAFDIDSDEHEVGIPGLHKELSVYGDVETEGNKVILKFCYPEDTKDPDDSDNELEDFEVEITYSSLGTQESVVYKDGDNVFYKKESVILNAVIFGFPVWALSIGGAGALTATAGGTFGIVKKIKK